MILWVILILVAIVAIFLLWWFSNFTPEVDDIESEFHPTIHARCQSNSTCGGDLICDLNCHRCRKQSGGDCANDVDCEFGLQCHDWKCSPVDEPKISDAPSKSSNKGDKERPKRNKSVRWADIDSK
jgi:hypothetical protein